VRRFRVRLADRIGVFQERCSLGTPSKEEKALFGRRLSGLLSGSHRSTRSHRHVRNWARGSYEIRSDGARQLDDNRVTVDNAKGERG